MTNIDLNRYKDFVALVTSEASNDLSALTKRMNELSDTPDVNVSLMVTAALGMNAEAGEFTEIVKKCLFQGKPLTDDNIQHIKLELGDIQWYWINACRAFNFDPNDVIAANVKKLEARYPGGKFDPYYSENRRPGDL
jgi:NTP pyrophosphatase (non-canonical NTP hydrolase)